MMRLKESIEPFPTIVVCSAFFGCSSALFVVNLSSFIISWLLSNGRYTARHRPLTYDGVSSSS